MRVRTDAGPEYGHGHTEIRSEVKWTVQKAGEGDKLRRFDKVSNALRRVETQHGAKIDSDPILAHILQSLVELLDELSSH